MIAAPRLLAGLMPVPVIGIVAKWTMNTANPIGNGANTFNYQTNNNNTKWDVVTKHETNSVDSKKYYSYSYVREKYTWLQMELGPFTNKVHTWWRESWKDKKFRWSMSFLSFIIMKNLETRLTIYSWYIGYESSKSKY